MTSDSLSASNQSLFEVRNELLGYSKSITIMQATLLVVSFTQNGTLLILRKQNEGIAYCSFSGSHGMHGSLREHDPVCPLFINNTKIYRRLG